MPKGRLEAFSDGVIAIIITIMVLEIKAPEGSSPADLLGMWSSLLSYALSFFFVGVYWNNHHHLLNIVGKVNGRMLWANLLFLFVLSMVPVATDWIDKTGFAAFPTVVYAVLNILVTLAYVNLEWVIHEAHRPNEDELEARRKAREGITPKLYSQMKRHVYAKERWTIELEILSLVLALLLPTQHLAYVTLIAAICLWIVPDLRIVHALDWLSEEDQTEED